MIPVSFLSFYHNSRRLSRIRFSFHIPVDIGELQFSQDGNSGILKPHPPLTRSPFPQGEGFYRVCTGGRLNCNIGDSTAFPRRPGRVPPASGKRSPVPFPRRLGGECRPRNRLSTEKGSAVIQITDEPTATPRGGGGRVCAGAPEPTGRSSLFPSLSLLSKRKRESDNVPPLGKRKEAVFYLQVKRTFAFRFLA